MPIVQNKIENREWRVMYLKRDTEKNSGKTKSDVDVLIESFLQLLECH